MDWETIEKLPLWNPMTKLSRFFLQWESSTFLALIKNFSRRSPRSFFGSTCIHWIHMSRVDSRTRNRWIVFVVLFCSERSSLGVQFFSSIQEPTVHLIEFTWFASFVVSSESLELLSSVFSLLHLKKIMMTIIAIINVIIPIVTQFFYIQAYNELHSEGKFYRNQNAGPRGDSFFSFHFWFIETGN